MHPVKMSENFLLGFRITHGWEKGTFPYFLHASLIASVNMWGVGDEPALAPTPMV